MKTRTTWMMMLLMSANLALASERAHASYLRFWRGVPRADVSQAKLVNLLNGKLLPETGKLATTAAQLRSYQPVLLADREVALVEYESEASYTAYRSTPEGKAYGDLHWELFAKDTSGSRVPEPFRGALELDHAYDVVGSDADWYAGVSFFRVYSRAAGLDDAQFLALAKAHVERALDAKPLGLVVLIERDRVLEYALYESAAHQARADRAPQTLPVLQQIRLRTSTAIRGAGDGVRYDLLQ